MTEDSNDISVILNAEFIGNTKSFYENYGREYGNNVLDFDDLLSPARNFVDLLSSEPKFVDEIMSRPDDDFLILSPSEYDFFDIPDQMAENQVTIDTQKSNAEAPVLKSLLASCKIQEIIREIETMPAKAIIPGPQHQNVPNHNTTERVKNMFTNQLVNNCSMPVRDQATDAKSDLPLKKTQNPKPLHDIPSKRIATDAKDGSTFQFKPTSGPAPANKRNPIPPWKRAAVITPGPPQHQNVPNHSTTKKAKNMFTNQLVNNSSMFVRNQATHGRSDLPAKNTQTPKRPHDTPSERAATDAKDGGTSQFKIPSRPTPAIKKNPILPRKSVVAKPCNALEFKVVKNRTCSASAETNKGQSGKTPAVRNGGGTSKFTNTKSNAVPGHVKTDIKTVETGKGPTPMKKEERSPQKRKAPNVDATSKRSKTQAQPAFEETKKSGPRTAEKGARATENVDTGTRPKTDETEEHHPGRRLYQLILPRLKVNDDGTVEKCRVGKATLDLLAKNSRNSKKDVRKKYPPSVLRKEKPETVDEKVRCPSKNGPNVNVSDVNVGKVKVANNKGQQQALIDSTRQDVSPAVPKDAQTMEPSTFVVIETESVLKSCEVLIKKMLDLTGRNEKSPSIPQESIQKSCLRIGEPAGTKFNSKKVGFALEHTLRDILEENNWGVVNFTKYYYPWNDASAATERETATNEFLCNVLTWHTNTWFQKYAQYGCKRAPVNEIRRLMNYQKQNSAIEKFQQFLKEILFLRTFKLLYKSWCDTNSSFVQLRIQSIKTDVDLNHPGHNWTIYTQRNSPKDSRFKDEIREGHILMLNLGTRCVFGYVTETEHYEKGKYIVQNISLEIRPLQQSGLNRDTLENLDIQILTTIKRILRQVLAITYVSKSPLADILISGQSNETSESNPDLEVIDEQKKAVAICHDDICFREEPSIRIIDGPPGTGKTQVLLDLIRELFSKEDVQPVDLKILVIANSDNAANEICVRLRNQSNGENIKVSILRYGTIENIDSRIHDLTIQHYLNVEEETEIDLEKRILRSKINARKFPHDANLSKIRNLEKDMQDLCNEDQKLTNRFKEDDIYSRTDVVVTSLGTCWTYNFKKHFLPCLENEGIYHKFTVCIIDDAHKIKSVDLLIPLMIIVRKVILIGDSHEILNESNDKIVNTGKENVKYEKVISTPYKELMKRSSPSAVVSLKNQYRINSKILCWFEPCFKIKFSVPPSNDDFIFKPLAVVNLISKQETIDAAIEFKNKARAICKRIVYNIEKLLDNTNTSIGIIVGEDNITKTKEMFRRTSKKVSVFVGNAEEFTGIEKDIIIVLFFPLAWGSALDRWLYSSLSRAKNSLIILDDFSQITGRKSAEDFVKMAKIRRSYITWSCDSEKHFPFEFFTNKKTLFKN